MGWYGSTASVHGLRMQSFSRPLVPAGTRGSRTTAIPSLGFLGLIRERPLPEWTCRSTRRQPPAAMGRVLPTAAVGYAVAQLGGQLSGGEIAHPTGAGRPKPEVRIAQFRAPKLPVALDSATAKAPTLGACCGPCGG
jgi:hypothetical protein